MRLAALLALVTLAAASAEDEKPQLLADAAREALERGDADAALAIADKAAATHPIDAEFRVIRGDAFTQKRQHDKAAAAYTEALKLDPNRADAADRRGDARLKGGDIPGAIADFEAFLNQRPKAYPSHWRYGIALYYAGRYADGAKQFKAGEAVFGDDVENAFWHFLCTARAESLEKAQAGVLDVRPDRRVPMMEVHAMIRGKLKPEDVLAVVADPKLPEAGKTERRFYGHLYVGLYREATGDAAGARRDLEAAEANVISHYMWDLAAMHRKRAGR